MMTLELTSEEISDKESAFDKEVAVFSMVDNLEFYIRHRNIINDIKDKIDDLLFIQPRVGKGGEVFNCYKIRTKRKGTENNAINTENKGEKTENDPRNIEGREWLRITGLDEVPQIINILKGDMTLFGARPLMLEEHNGLSEDGKYLRESKTPGYLGTHVFSEGGKLTNWDAAEEYLRWKEYYEGRNMWEKLNFDAYVLYKSLEYIVGLNNK